MELGKKEIVVNNTTIVELRDGIRYIVIGSALLPISDDVSIIYLDHYNSDGINESYNVISVNTCDIMKIFKFVNQIANLKSLFECASNLDDNSELLKLVYDRESDENVNIVYRSIANTKHKQTNDNDARMVYIEHTLGNVVNTINILADKLNIITDELSKVKATVAPLNTYGGYRQHQLQSMDQFNRPVVMDNAPYRQEMKQHAQNVADNVNKENNQRLFKDGYFTIINNLALNPFASPGWQRIYPNINIYLYNDSNQIKNTFESGHLKHIKNSDMDIFQHWTMFGDSNIEIIKDDYGIPVNDFIGTYDPNCIYRINYLQPSMPSINFAQPPMPNMCNRDPRYFNQFKNRRY